MLFLIRYKRKYESVDQELKKRNKEYEELFQKFNESLEIIKKFNENNKMHPIDERENVNVNNINLKPQEICQDSLAKKIKFQDNDKEGNMSIDQN